MKNTDILRKHFAPYFDKENREKDFLNCYFLTKFRDSINSYCKSVGSKYISIDDLVSYYDENGVKRDQRRNLTFEEALEKHSDVINKWTPSSGLDVFWLKDFYSLVNKEVLSDFYDVFGDELFDEVLKKRQVYVNDLVLINLGLIKKRALQNIRRKKS